MMHFSGWNIFGTLGALLSAQGINIILNIFFGPIAVAARAISMQVSGGLSQFVNGFQQAVTPQITKLYASNQLEEMNKLLYQNSKYAFLLLWFFFRKKKLPSGGLGVIYLVMYSLIRSTVTIFRADDLMIGNFRSPHVISFIMIIVSIIFFIVNKKKARE